jgi:hypothetical protein
MGRDPPVSVRTFLSLSPLQIEVFSPVESAASHMETLNTDSTEKEEPLKDIFLSKRKLPDVG